MPEIYATVGPHVEKYKGAGYQSRLLYLFITLYYDLYRPFFRNFMSRALVVLN
jgi:hypothetical protein